MPAEPGAMDRTEATRAETAPASGATEQGIAGESSAAERTTAAYTPEPAVEAWQQERQQKAAAGSEQRRLYAARAAAPASARGTDGGAAGSGNEQVTVSVRSA